MSPGRARGPVERPRRGGQQRIPRPPVTTPGGPAPWAHVEELPPFDLATVRRALAASAAPRAPAWEVPGARPSAVLVPLFEEAGALRVLLTRRASHLRAHQGEVAFPGGARHGDEDLVTTALREAEEEIGLDPGRVEIIGELDHLATVSSRFEIVPFVGALAGRPDLAPNPEEIDRVFDVAVIDLLHEDVFREEQWMLPYARTIAFFELADETVWGATAAILRHFLTLLATGGGPVTPAV